VRHVSKFSRSAEREEVSILPIGPLQFFIALGDYDPESASRRFVAASELACAPRLGIR